MSDLRLTAYGEGFTSGAGTGCSDGNGILTCSELDRSVSFLVEQFEKILQASASDQKEHMESICRHVDNCIEKQTSAIDDTMSKHFRLSTAQKSVRQPIERSPSNASDSGRYSFFQSARSPTMSGWKRRGNNKVMPSPSSDPEAFKRKGSTRRMQRFSVNEREKKDNYASQALCAFIGEQSLDQQNARKSFDVAKIVRSQKFDIFCAFALLSNAVVVGIQVETLATSPKDKEPVVFLVMEYIFTLWFLFELLLRLYGIGIREFFLGFECCWNAFDCAVVITGTAETVISLIVSQGGSDSSSSGMANISAFRTIRIARVVRVVRVLRLMRFFHSLRILVKAIFSTVRSCMWTSLLLCMILYIFGLLFAQAVTEYLDNADEMEVALSPNTEALNVYFGSLFRSVFTCFKSILGGVDWDIAVTALSDLGFFYVMMFTILIIFVNLAVMNVISGLFLQSAIEQAQQDLENMISQQREEKEKYAKRFEHVFEQIDHDGDHVISMQEFEQALTKSMMQGLLQALDIEAGNAWTLWKLLDVNGDGRLERSEFVDGCLKLKGMAKSIQIEQQRYEVKFLMDSVTEFALFCEECFQDLSMRIKGSNSAEEARADSPELFDRPRSPAFATRSMQCRDIWCKPSITTNYDLDDSRGSYARSPVHSPQFGSPSSKSKIKSLGDVEESYGNIDSDASSQVITPGSHSHIQPPMIEPPQLPIGITPAETGPTSRLKGSNSISLT